MPVIVIDGFPIPSFKVYSISSCLLLSYAVYSAVKESSAGGWRVNATRDAGEGGMEPLAPSATQATYTDHLYSLVTYIIQDSLCMWAFRLSRITVRWAVLGPLRPYETQRIRDKFWNYVFYKFIFVFGVINVQYLDEVLLWCGWFSIVGSLLMMGQMAKDRFDHLSISREGGRWALLRVVALEGGIVLVSAAIFALCLALWPTVGTHTFLFMGAECLLVLFAALQVLARYLLLIYDFQFGTATAYYTHLIFDSVRLVTELAHVVHMVAFSNMLVSTASLVLLLQLRHVLHELRARVRRHRLYTERANHITRNCPMASEEELSKNEDKCAICWEALREARRLPCGHLFHGACLCRWVQHEPSCPTCRRELSAPLTPPPPPHDTLFHFDGSRYVSWLPSVSVEVARGRSPLAEARLHLTQLLSPDEPAHIDVPLLAPALHGRLLTSSPLDEDDDDEDEVEVRRPPSPPPPPPAVPAVSPALPVPPLDIDKCETAGEFGESAEEREEALAARKRRLVAAARARYLARHPPAHT